MQAAQPLVFDALLLAMGCAALYRATYGLLLPAHADYGRVVSTLPNGVFRALRPEYYPGGRRL